MNYIAFDFETSGLPRGRRNAKVTRDTISNFDGCRAVSLSAARFSQRGRLTKTFDAIIRPDDFHIGADSTAIHGITHERAVEEGRPFTEVFRDFMEFIGPHTKTLVAHNAQFDVSVLHSEMLRHDLDQTLIDDFEFQCTLQMYKANNFMTPIKLTQLYKDIFGEEFDNAHNSLADSIACGKVYPHLKEQAVHVHKPVPVKKVVIKASDVSSILGLSQFKKPMDVVEELWRKHLPETCTLKSKDDRAREVIENTPTLHGVETRFSGKELLDEVEGAPITPAQKGLVKDYFRKSMSMYRGGQQQESTFYTYNVCSIEGTLYQIMGRVGQLRPNDDGSHTLVEMKTRNNGLFNRLRDYEEVQCRVYLAMLPPTVRDCLLVESYEGDMKSYLVMRDSEKWSGIHERVRQFCSCFHHHISHKD